MAFLWGSFIGGDGKGGGLAPTVARNLRSQKDELDKILVAGAQQAATSSRETRMNRIKSKNEYEKKARFLISLGLNVGQAESVLAGGLEQADLFAEQLKNDQLYAKTSYMKNNNGDVTGFDYNGAGFNGRNRNAFLATNFKIREGGDKMPIVGRDLVALAKNYAIKNNPNLDDRASTLQAGMSILGGFYGDAPQGYAEDKFAQTYSVLGGTELDNTLVAGQTPYEFTLSVSDPETEAQIASTLAGTALTQVRTAGLKVENVYASSTLSDRIMAANFAMKRGEVGLVNDHMKTLINQLELKDMKMQDKHKTDKWYKDMNTFTYQKALNDSGIYDPNTQLGLLSTKMAQITSKYVDTQNRFTGNITDADDLARYNKLNALHNGILGTELAKLSAKADATDTDKVKYFKTFNDMFHKNLSVNINSTPTLNDKVSYTEIENGVFQFTNLAADTNMSSAEIIERNRQIAEITLQTFNSTATTLKGFQMMGVASAEQAMVNAATFANDAFFRFTGDSEKKLIDTDKNSATYLQSVLEIPSKAAPTAPAYDFSVNTKFDDDAIQGVTDLFNSQAGQNQWNRTIRALSKFSVDKSVIRNIVDHLTKEDFTYNHTQVSNLPPVKFSHSLSSINAGGLVSVLQKMGQMDKGKYKNDIASLTEAAKNYNVGNMTINLLDISQYNQKGLPLNNVNQIAIKQLQLKIYNDALDIIRN